MGAYIQEGKFAFLLRFDGEFDVWLDAIYVFSELFHVPEVWLMCRPRIVVTMMGVWCCRDGGFIKLFHVAISY